MDDTPKRRRGRPVTPTGTPPVRTVRVGPIWDEAVIIAASRGETVADVIRRTLANYVRRHHSSSLA
jgi:hypothetical protein